VASLIAQGPQPHWRWRRRLRAGERVVLGRAAGHWAVPWDEKLSRNHVELYWKDGALHVVRLPSARNPVFFRGQEQDDFALAPGEHFVIGETTFTLVVDEVSVTQEVPRPVEEQTFSRQMLQNVRFRNAHFRLEVLGRLPEVISGASGAEELSVRLVNILLAGIPRATAVALVVTNPAAGADAPVNVLHWDRRITVGAEFHPSHRLIQEAVAQQQSVLHVWRDAQDASLSEFTVIEGIDWSFCTPVPGDACHGWALYVAGGRAGQLPTTPDASGPADLKEDVKFAEIVAATLGSLMQLRKLEQRQATLSQFFPPAVLRALEYQNADEVLAPREADVSVLFCDLRGFSRKAEEDAGDLLGLLRRVSQALGVMVHHILEQSGVVGDFQGDAAMGFWGWPLVQHDAVERACLAALAIRREFEAAAQRPGHPMSDFRAGIGLATGRAVAGGIGTSTQQKVTVFGPVVNLAARLEGMTKVLHAPILIDRATAEVVRQRLPRSLARCRRVAVVQPYGMQTPVELSELLPPEQEHPALSDRHLACYERALDAFLDGHWSEALELLHEVPARDRVKDFLTVYIVQRNRTPPPDWNGVIQMLSKS
jgi:adenylate cyclase